MIDFHFRETNLKVRQSLEEIQEIGDDIDYISQFNGLKINFISFQYKNPFISFR